MRYPKKKMNKKIKNYLIDNKIRFLVDSAIGDFLTMRVGGKVGFIIFTDSNGELTDVLDLLFPLKQKCVLIGGGSNIVFPDSGDELIVIINNSSEIKMEKQNTIRVNTGLKNTDFLEYCKKNNIAGFEFLAGIPGTLGGATAVNAGAFGKSISDNITGGDIFTDDGKFEYKDKDFFNFEYRNSRFKYGKDIIINIYLKYEQGNKTSIKNSINEIVKLRTEKHPPYSSFTAGCFFKNPEVEGKKISAGKLIENCEMKGYETDEAMISDKHSNFIVNKGSAGFSDIEKLGRKIQEIVKKNKGISLEREVIFVSPDGEKY